MRVNGRAKIKREAMPAMVMADPLGVAEQPESLVGILVYYQKVG